MLVSITRTVLLLSLLPGCNESGSGGPSCGEGTIEVAGVCVPATDDDASTGPSGSSSPTGTGNTTHNDNDNDNDDDGSGGTSSASGDPTTGAKPPYASCFSGSDVECAGYESCMDAVATCAADCLADTDCPPPPSGTAVQRCEVVNGYYESCVLYCGVEGATCPDGMVCREPFVCDEGDGGSSSTGGWGGTTGCDSSLPICIWE